MPHKFEIMINGHVQSFNRYEEIPDQFDHVIAFIPEVPPPPHSDQDHNDIESWAGKFERLLEIERASSRKNG